MHPAALAPILSVLAAPPFLQDAQAPEDPFERHSLAKGVELWVLHVPGAARQSVFVIYERGFFAERDGVPQAAHLAEHLAVRSLDPDSLEVDGVRINGETQGSTMRLEALGTVEAWPTTVERISHWMGVGDAQASVLEVERGRMALEVDNTAPAGFTGKWAQAAWTQAVRHGADDVLVRDGLAAIDEQRVRSLLDWHVRLARPVRVVVVGPLEPEKVREDLERATEELPPVQAHPAWGATPIPTGEHVARWDLPGAHYLEWYELAGNGLAQRVAGELLATQMTMALQRSGLTPDGAHVQVSLERMSSRAWALLISFVPSPELDAAALREALDGRLDWLRGESGEKHLRRARWTTTRPPVLPDFEQLRERQVGRPGGEFLEAQVGLTLAQQEVRLGCSPLELRRVAAELTGEGFEAFVAQTLDPERRGTLTLRPSD